MFQRILVAVDGSVASTYALAEAIKLARLSGGQIRLIHILDEVSMMDAFAASAPEWPGILKEAGLVIVKSAEQTVREGGVVVSSIINDIVQHSLAEQVVIEAVRWQADLIVIGTHGRHGIARLMIGSSAESILRIAPVPVLLIRATGSGSAETAAAEHVVDNALPA